MDIHLNVWGIKTREDGENVAIKLREVESKLQVIGHMSRATAQILYDDLGKLLSTKANEETKTGQEK